MEASYDIKTSLTISGEEQASLTKQLIHKIGAFSHSQRESLARSSPGLELELRQHAERLEKILGDRNKVSHISLTLIDLIVTDYT